MYSSFQSMSQKTNGTGHQSVKGSVLDGTLNSPQNTQHSLGAWFLSYQSEAFLTPIAPNSAHALSGFPRVHQKSMLHTKPR